MSLRQIFKPDFWVCEWEGECQSGTFPALGRTYNEAIVDAANFLRGMEHLPDVVTAQIRRPTLLERWRAHDTP